MAGNRKRDLYKASLLGLESKINTAIEGNVDDNGSIGDSIKEKTFPQKPENISNVVHIKPEEKPIIKAENKAVVGPLFDNQAQNTSEKMIQVQKHNIPEQQEGSEVQVSDASDTKEKSLNEIVREYLEKIEVAKNLEKQSGGFKKKTEQKHFRDRLPLIGFAARKEYHELLDILKENSSMNKYELLELIFVNGLKNTNFD